MSERSGSPSKVPKIFSKTKNRKNSPSNSSNSEASEKPRLQQSLENAIDKLKGHSDEEGHSGIKKIVPKALVSKRRRRKQEEEREVRATEEVEEAEEAEAARGRSVAERGTLRNNSYTPSNESEDTSSMMTYEEESDGESPFGSRPPLSTHPSHAGYLTSSSPHLRASISPQVPTNISLSDTPDGTASDSKPFRRANALAASNSVESLASDNKLRAPTNASQKRSPSPVGRLKEAFKPRRGASPNGSPDRKGESSESLVEKPQSTGNSRRGSVVSRIFEKQGQQTIIASSSPERPRTSKLQPIDTHATPQTPPPGDSKAPTIVNTPPTPTDVRDKSFASSRERVNSDPPAPNSNVVTSPSGNMISHRRGRSNSATIGPSKLSNITSAPLTPLPEDGSKTPNQGGFFSSVFSAAQNAANTLSSSIANTSVAPNTNKTKSTQDLKDIVENPEVETLADKTSSENTQVGEKEPAVKTLGMGDLSLSHLGISETTNGSNIPMASKFQDDPRSRANTNEEPIVAPSGTVTEGFETGPQHAVDDAPTIPPRSNYEPSAGEQTPPNGSVYEGKPGIQRSGSVRSAKFGPRRNRGSSAATGTTIGAALMASHSGLSSPNAASPKITGFAVASKKRNRDFHNLFRSVPEDDYLIEDYSCALQREILAHGRLYVSEGHLCFSSNIFGWVTTLVMSFDEIVSVEKRSTALLFKNGLMISTLHAKNVFASFTSRDSTYDLIVGIWKLGHPSLRSSLNGVSIPETGGGDKTEKYDGGAAAPQSQSGSNSDSDGEDGDEIYDEDEEDEDGMSFTQADGSVAGSDIPEKVVSRKPSAAVVTNGATLETKADISAAPVGDFPGPATHAPTKCGDSETHYSKVLADEIIPAPMGKVWSILFGPASTVWMKDFLTVNQKCFDLIQEGVNAQPLSVENKVRNYTYIKPLSGAIGPKQTKCISTETLDSFDLDKAVSVTIGTQNPDVPSGNVFSVKTRYCLMWAENNQTRLLCTCTIEWTGKSWLKGPIEKGTNDGQMAYAKDLVAALRAGVSSRRPAGAAVGGKGKRKGRKGRESKGGQKTLDGASDSKPAVQDWGLFEPVHGIFGPIVDITGPLLTGNIVYGLLVGLLVASWFGFGFPGRGNGQESGMGFIATPERIAAYEEIWRREESELWEWLEDRVGTARLRDAVSMPIEAKNIQDRLRTEKIEERQVDAAIRATEEKLRVLKGSVARKKETVKGGEKNRKEGEEKNKKEGEEKNRKENEE